MSTHGRHEARTSWSGPLAGNYGGAVALVLLCLTPYLVLSSAFSPVQMLVGADLHMSMRTLQLATGMANAAYAFGAVLAVQLAAKLPQRRLLISYSSVFVAGSVLAATATQGGFFIAGHVLQGFGTGLMLIAAVPPLILSFGKEKLPITAVVMNLGLFGAVALGPVVGGASGGTTTWRPLFYIIAGLGVLALLLTVLTFEDDPAGQPEAPVDLIALSLAVAACASLFFGVSELTGRSPLNWLFLVPVGCGAAFLVALLVHQYVALNPLIPVRQLVHTVPVAAIVIAMAAGAGSIALIELAETGLMIHKDGVYHASVLFWPEFGAAIAAAILFGKLFFTRWSLVLALGGLFVLAGGGFVVLGSATTNGVVVLVGSGLIGFGVGSSVSPALFLAAFSIESPLLPRVFAIVELLRGVAAFLVGPLLLQLAMRNGRTPAVGNKAGVYVACGLVLLGAVIASVVLALGRHRLRAPVIDPWLAGEQPALTSAPVGDALRTDAEENGGSRKLEKVA